VDEQPESTIARIVTSGIVKRHQKWLAGLGREFAAYTSVHCAPPV